MAGVNSSRESESLPLWFGGGLYGKGDVMLWYRIDAAAEEIRTLQQREAIDGDQPPVTLSTGKSLELPIEAVSVHSGMGVSFTSAALAPFIYCVSEKVLSPSSDLLCLDTRNIHKGWRSFKMITPRASAMIAAMQGKIYIAGGTLSILKPWGEVFNPATRQSRPMPPFPADFRFEPTHLQLMGTLPGSKKLVFFSQVPPGDIVFFDVYNQIWSLVPNAVPTRLERFIGSYVNWSDRRCAFVGTTVYWFDWEFFLYAYDFDKAKSYSSGHLKEFAALGRPCGNGAAPAVVHLYGGYHFCVLWKDSRLQKYQDSWCSRIHCTKVNVNIIDDSQVEEVRRIDFENEDLDIDYIPPCRRSLNVSVMSSHSYLVNGHFFFNNALLVA